jgi:hypothetical protein
MRVRRTFSDQATGQHSLGSLIAVAVPTVDPGSCCFGYKLCNFFTLYVACKSNMFFAYGSEP